MWKTKNRVEDYPFHEISPDLYVTINPRAKRLALRLDPKNRCVRLTVPKNKSIKRAYLFAKNYREWIKNEISSLPQSVPFSDGATIPFLGEERKILITYDKGLRITDISLKKGEIHVSTNKEDPQGRIERFLKKTAGEEIEEITRKKAAAINKKVKEIRIKDTHSRWGSCSVAGKISLSWRLAFAPPVSMDYVIAHEVAHLIHMNHSKDFWDLCDSLSTDMKQGKSWMRKNGNSLLQYGKEE